MKLARFRGDVDSFDSGKGLIETHPGSIFEYFANPFQVILQSDNELNSQSDCEKSIQFLMSFEFY